MAKVHKCGTTDEQQDREWMNMYTPDPEMSARLQSEPKFSSIASNYDIKYYTKNPGSSKPGSNSKLKAYLKRPSRAPEASVNARNREYEVDVDLGAKKDKMKKQRDCNDSKALLFTTRDQASESSGQSQDCRSNTKKNMPADANAIDSKSSEASSTLRQRHGPVQLPCLAMQGSEFAEGDSVPENRAHRIHYQAYLDADTCPVRHHTSPSRIPVCVKNKKLQSGRVPIRSVKGKDIENPTIVSVEKGNVATTRTQPVEQTHCSNAKNFQVGGSDSLLDQSKPTTKGSKYEVNHSLTTVSEITDERNGDGPGIASSALKSPLVQIYNSGHIGTIEARDKPEVSLSNSKRDTTKLFELSQQITIELHNTGHIDYVLLS